MRKFSVFRKPVSNCKPLKEWGLVDAYNFITGSKAEAATRGLRALPAEDNNARKKYKCENFNHCTFGGSFSYRSAANLKEASELICIDLDHLSDLEEAFDALKACPDIVTRLLFRSPSGDGLKWIVEVEISEAAPFKLWYDAISEFLSERYALQADKQCSDITHTCYLPWDPEAYINTDTTQHTTLDPHKWGNAQPAPSRGASEPLEENEMNAQWLVEYGQKRDVEAFVRDIKAREIDITGKREQWLKIGFALAGLYREDSRGREIFHEISQYYNGYSSKEANKVYDDCLNTGRGCVNIETFYKYCYDCGASPMPEQEQEGEPEQEKPQQRLHLDLDLFNAHGAALLPRLAANIASVYGCPIEFVIAPMFSVLSAAIGS